MSDTLSSIKAEAEKKIETAGDQESLEEIRVSILGKKGALTQILKSMKESGYVLSKPYFYNTQVLLVKENL